MFNLKSADQNVTNHFMYDSTADRPQEISVIFLDNFFTVHFICNILLNDQQNSSDMFIDSTTLPLHFLPPIYSKFGLCSLA
jgi:hypothetical protein